MGGKCGSWALGLLWFLARLGIVGIGVSDFCSWSQGLCVLHPQCCCHLFVPKLVPPPWRTLSYMGAGLCSPRACCEPAPASHLLAHSKVRQLSGLVSAGPRVCWLDEYTLSYGHPSACSSAAGNVAQCSNYRYADSTSKWLETISFANDGGVISESCSHWKQRSSNVPTATESQHTVRKG